MEELGKKTGCRSWLGPPPITHSTCSGSGSGKVPSGDGKCPSGEGPVWPFVSPKSTKTELGDGQHRIRFDEEEKWLLQGDADQGPGSFCLLPVAMHEIGAFRRGLGPDACAKADPSLPRRSLARACAQLRGRRHYGAVLRGGAGRAERGRCQGSRRAIRRRLVSAQCSTIPDECSFCLFVH